MTVAELQAAIRAFMENRSGFTFDHSRVLTVEDVLAEMRVVMTDVERFGDLDAASLADGWGGAGLAAQWRDFHRPVFGRYGMLGEAAVGFGRWAYSRADRGSVRASFAAAKQAVEGDQSEAVLAGELRDFIGGELSGTIDPTEALRRRMDPRGSLTPPVPRRRRRRRPARGAISLDRAADALADRIAADAPGEEPLEIWSLFQAFARVPISPVYDEVIDAQDDLLLCEWGVFRGPGRADAEGAFLVSLVRQVTVCDHAGAFVDYVQVHIELRFESCSELEDLGSGVIWSDGGMATYPEFFAAIEADAVRIALSGRYGVAAVTVYQDSTE